jgi:hypothetical protein
MCASIREWVAISCAWNVMIWKTSASVDSIWAAPATFCNLCLDLMPSHVGTSLRYMYVPPLGIAFPAGDIKSLLRAAYVTIKLACET